MTLWLIDTNVASHVVRGDQPKILARLTALPVSSIAVSAVTEAELLYGLAKRGNPRLLSEKVRTFLRIATVFPWDRDAAESYARLRDASDRAGRPIAALDLMIAAHAHALGAVLVSQDRDFEALSDHVTLERWA